MPAPDSRNNLSPQLIAWCAVAVVGGMACLILPPYLTEGGLKNPAYGWPLIPWFAHALANRQFAASMTGFLVLGLTLGLGQPRWWHLLSGAAVVLPAILHIINIVHDWTRDSTSHNLFPIEFLLYGFICSPVLFGAVLGFGLRHLLRKLKGSSPSTSSHG